MRPEAFARWMLFHAGWMIVLTAVALAMRRPEAVAWGAFPSMAVLYWAEGKLRGSWRFVLEAANALTGLRLAIVLSLFMVYGLLGPVWVAVWAVVALLLDGVDGWVARRRGTVSAFGGWLDKETDALYVLVLSLLLAHAERLGGWIIGIGLLRYLYYVSIWPWRQRRAEEPRFRMGQVVAGVLMGCLPAGFVVPAAYYRPVIGVVALLVLVSFLASAYHLFVSSKQRLS